jgi:hypothetical protein
MFLLFDSGMIENDASCFYHHFDDLTNIDCSPDYQGEQHLIRLLNNQIIFILLSLELHHHRLRQVRFIISSSLVKSLWQAMW